VTSLIGGLHSFCVATNRFLIEKAANQHAHNNCDLYDRYFLLILEFTMYADDGCGGTIRSDGTVAATSY
jgi:hypothetical protein